MSSELSEVHQSPDCPTCGREFASPRGMRVHHTTVHGERVPDRYCTDCGNAFYATYTERKRCDDCTSTQRGSSDPTRGNTTGVCLICESEFQYYPSEKAGRYCPACVADPDVSCTIHQREASDNRVTIDCSFCEEAMQLYPSEVEEGRNHFCDRECYREWLSTTQRTEEKWCGADNPNWRGGVHSDELYGEGWPQARRRALERDQYTCQRCGDSCGDIGRNPDVHHIRPVRTYENPTKAHILNNLVCLCRPCHLTVERGNASVKTPTQEES